MSETGPHGVPDATPGAGGQGRWLPMFPLQSVLFPGALLPLHVFEPRYRELTRRCVAGDREFGVVLISRGSEVGGGDERVSTGTVAHIEAVRELDDGRYALLGVGTRRLRIREWLPDDPFPQAIVDELVERAPDPPAPGEDDPVGRAEASVRRARALLSELEAPTGRDLDEVPSGPADDDASLRVWRLCALAPVTQLDQLALLEADDPGERLELLARLADEVADDARRMLAQGR